MLTRGEDCPKCGSEVVSETVAHQGYLRGFPGPGFLIQFLIHLQTPPSHLQTPPSQLQTPRHTYKRPVTLTNAPRHLQTPRHICKRPVTFTGFIYTFLTHQLDSATSNPFEIQWFGDRTNRFGNRSDHQFESTASKPFEKQ